MLLTVPPAQLLFHFDEGFGAQTLDSSTNHVIGALNNGQSWARLGLIGPRAMTFNGNYALITTTDGSNYFVLDPLLGGTATFSAWINTTQIGNATPYLAPGLSGIQPDTGGSNAIFWGWIDASGRIGVSAGTKAGAKSINPINDGKWHHVAFTRDAITGQVKTYVDGVLNSTAVSDTGQKTSQFAQIGSVGRSPVNYIGEMDEVAVYSQVLSDAEVASLAVIPPPAAPSSLVAFTDNTHVAVNWSNNAATTTGFTLERSTDPTFATVDSVDLGPGAVNYVDTNVQSATTYYYRILATSAQGNSAYSNTAAATIGSTPQGLVGHYYDNQNFTGDPAVTQLDSTINFGLGATWPPATIPGDKFAVIWTGKVHADTTGTYKFVTATDDGALLYVNGQQVSEDFSLHGLQNAGDTTPIQLSAGQDYDVFFKYFQGGGYAAAQLQWITPSSNGGMVIVPADHLTPLSTAPAAPSNLAAIAITTTQASLTWTDNALNELKHTVERATDPSFANAMVVATLGNNTTATMAFIDKGLLPNTHYYYRVRASNGDGDSAYATLDFITPATEPVPAAPTNLYVVPARSGISNRVIWTDVALNETSYKIQRKLGVNGTYATIKTLPANSTNYTDAANLVGGTQYFYRVIANNLQGDSIPSAEFAVKAGPPAGKGLLATIFDNMDFTGKTVTKLMPQPYFGFGYQQPDPGISENTFTILFEGQIQAEYTETYTFHALVDDGITLDVGGARVIDSLYSNSPTPVTGTIQLQAGQKYDIKIRYLQILYNSALTLTWSSPSLPEEVLPTELLYPPNFTQAPLAAPVVAASPFDGGVRLDFSDLSPNETGFDILRSIAPDASFAKIGSLKGDTVLSYVDTSASADGTTYYYEVAAVNNTGTAVSNVASATPTSLASLPSPWLQADVNPDFVSQPIPGEATFNNGVFDLTGNGRYTLFDGQDGVQFVYQPMTGDGTFTARVLGIDFTSPAFSKAGIMFRNDLTGGAAATMVSMSNGGGIFFQGRSHAFGGLDLEYSASNSVIPAYLQLTRRGNTFFASYSLDGITFTRIGNSSFNISMGQTIDVGLAISSGDPSIKSSASFDNVSLQGPGVGFSASTKSASEAGGPIIIPVQLSSVTGKDVTVPFTLGGTAVLGTDYTISVSPVFIPAGQSSANITVTPINNNLDAPDKTVILTLGTAINAVSSGSKITVTITDDDPPPTVHFTTAKQATSESGNPLTITAELSTLSGKNVTVPLTFAGSAIKDQDYSVSSTSIVIPAGSLTGSVTLTPTTDQLAEGPETITIGMGVLVNATSAGTTVQTETIYDDNTLSVAVPNLSVVTTATTVSGFFDITFKVPAGVAANLAGYTLALSLNPAAAGVKLTGADLASNPVFPGQLPSFQVAGDHLQASAVLPGVGPSIALTDGMGLIRVFYDVLPNATAGIVQINIDTLDLFDQNADPITPLNSVNGQIQVVDQTAPMIKSVKVSGSSWAAAFPYAGGYALPVGSGHQLDPLPWSNLNTLSIVFTEKVSVQQSDLSLIGSNVPSYPFSGFAYDPATFTATWTLPSPITNDRLKLELSDQVQDAVGLHLDGDWQDGVSPSNSGDGTPGGNFDFHLNVLRGDVNQSGDVGVDDVLLVHNAQFTAPGNANYNALEDVNASGSIAANDVLLARNQQFTALPIATPGRPSAAAGPSSGVLASVQSISLAGSENSPVNGFVEVLVSVSAAMQPQLAGYEAAVSLSPASSGLNLGGVTFSGSSVFAGQTSLTFNAAGSGSRVSDYLPNAHQQTTLPDGSVLFRVNFTVNPSTYGTFHLSLSSVRMFDGSVVPLTLDAPVAGTITITATPSSPTVTGGNGEDAIYLRMDSRNTNVLVWNNTLTTGDPNASYPLADLTKLSIAGANGNDQLTLDFANGNPIPAGGLSYDGGAGLDSIHVLGSTSGAVNIVGGSVRFLNDANGLAVSASNSTNIQFATSQHLASLVLNDDATANVVAGTSNVLLTHNLSIAPAANLDLADGSLILAATPVEHTAALASVTGWIKAGRNGGAWNGHGITSSTAAAEPNKLTGFAITLNDKGAGTPLYTSFNGEIVDANSILVKYTYNGDADLSGKIDADDYFQIDNGFASRLAGYRNGDFDFNGVVDADDYFLIDRAFAGQTSVLAINAPSAPAGPPLARVVSHHRARHHRISR